MALFDDVFSLFERPLGATEDVDSAGASLGKGIDDFPSDTLTGTCDDDGLAGLG